MERSPKKLFKIKTVHNIQYSSVRYVGQVPTFPYICLIGFVNRPLLCFQLSFKSLTALTECHLSVVVQYPYILLYSIYCTL
jgi:hypothetical protein